LLILLAYLLLSMGRLTGQSVVKQAKNLAAPAGNNLNARWHGPHPTAVLNDIWKMIGTVASWRILARRRKVAEATD
jgi:hypothetical protein